MRGNLKHQKGGSKSQNNRSNHGNIIGKPVNSGQQRTQRTDRDIGRHCPDLPPGHGDFCKPFLYFVSRGKQGGLNDSCGQQAFRRPVFHRSLGTLNIAHIVLNGFRQQWGVLDDAPVLVALEAPGSHGLRQLIHG